MDGATLIARWLPGSERYARAHRSAGQQLDDLCAVHWASILLAGDGVTVVDAETLALEAGTRLPPDRPAASVPRGAAPRRDHRRRLPTSTLSSDSGTSVPGLIAAIASASSEARALVPLLADWSAERVLTVLDLCRSHPAWQVVPLANVRTGAFWGASLAFVDAASWLDGGDVVPPEPDWDVGHFVAIAGTLEGSARTMLVVRDSYPGLGWDAHHLQPPEAMARALVRGDGRQGGIALYAAAHDRADVERAAKDAGFEIGTWDNGTPWPPRGERDAVHGQDQRGRSDR